MIETPVRLPRRPRVSRWLPSLLLFALPAAAGGQGVTTGAIAGIVTDSAGGPVADGNVVAIHVPTGTQYRAVTRSSGAYALPNVRIGGPYTVTASFIGFRAQARENLFVTLGE